MRQGRKRLESAHDYRYGKIPALITRGVRTCNHTSTESSPVGYHGGYKHTLRLLSLAARSGYRLQSPVALVPLTYHLRYDPEFKGRKDLGRTFFLTLAAHR